MGALVCRKGGSLMCAGQGASNENSRALASAREQASEPRSLRLPQWTTRKRRGSHRADARFRTRTERRSTHIRARPCETDHLAGGGQVPLPASPWWRARRRAGKARPGGGCCADGERGEHQRGARRACGARGRVRRPAVSERVRVELAGRRSGRAVYHWASGQADSVGRAAGSDRQPLPPCGQGVRRRP
jgi:hypothetical protein